MEAARGNDEKQGAHEEEHERVRPEVDPLRTAEDDAAGDVDVVGRGNEIAEDVEEFGHGLAGENITGEENAGKDGEKSELHRMGLRRGLAGNENPKGEGDEEVRKREEGQEQDAAMDGHEEKETHGEKQHAEFEETDGQIGKELAKKESHWTYGGDEELFQRAAFFFANDGECGEEGSDVEEQDGDQAREEEIGGAGIGVEEDFRAHFDREDGGVIGEHATERLIEADGGGDVDGLPSNGGVRAIDKHEDLCAHLVEQLVGIVDGDFDADAAFAGDNGVIEVAVVIDVADEMESVGVFQAVEQFAALGGRRRCK